MHTPNQFFKAFFPLTTNYTIFALQVPILGVIVGFSSRRAPTTALVRPLSGGRGLEPCLARTKRARDATLHPQPRHQVHLLSNIGV